MISRARNRPQSKSRHHVRPRPLWPRCGARPIHDRDARIESSHLLENARDSMSSTRPDIAELELHELEAALTARGVQAFHARQLYRWIYRRGVTSFEAMTDLSRSLRAELEDEFAVSAPRVVGDERSVDGTRKFAF